MPTAGKERRFFWLLLGVLGALGVENHAWQEAPKDEKPAAPPSVALLTRLKPDKTFDVGGTRSLLSAGDSVWVASREAGAVTRIDPKAGSVAATIALESPPCGGLADSFGSIWVPLCGAKPGLVRIDSKTNKVAATITRGFDGVAGAPVTAVASVWALTGARTLGRFDPDTNAEVAEVNLPAAVNAIASGQGALWLASAATNSIYRINPNTNLLVETIKVGPAPRSLAIGEGSVWSLNEGDATVSRIDPKTNKVSQTIKLGTKPASGQIAAGEGSVWISTAGSPLLRIDPRTNHVVQIFTGEGGGALALGQGSIWLAADAKSIWRLDPRLVEATR